MHAYKGFCCKSSFLFCFCFTVLPTLSDPIRYVLRCYMFYLLFSYSNDAFTPPLFLFTFCRRTDLDDAFSFRSKRLKSSHCSHFLSFFLFGSDQIRSVESSCLFPFCISDCAYAVSCYLICLDQYSLHEGFGSKRIMRI